MHVSPLASRLDGEGNRFIRQAACTPFEGKLRLATWNVEGLTHIKIYELIQFMRRRCISVLCIQETHILKSPYYTVDGFLVILSGSSSGERETAGVGFILSPNAQKSLVGFLQQTNRLACLKLRVKFGQIAIISAYAPHSGWAFDDRQAFFQQLSTMYERTSVNGVRMILGDLNARTGHALPGEDDILGPYTFGNNRVLSGAGTNRDLLLELCAEQSLAVANTFCDNPLERAASYRHIGTERSAPITERSHLLLDLMLLPMSRLKDVDYIHSDPLEPLASHHFAVIMQLDMTLEAPTKSCSSYARDRSALRDKSVAEQFATEFSTFLKYQAPKNTATPTSSVDDLSTAIDDAFRHAQNKCLPAFKSQRK